MNDGQGRQLSRFMRQGKGGDVSTRDGARAARAARSVAARVVLCAAGHDGGSCPRQPRRQPSP